MSDVKGYVYRVRPGHWQWQVIRDGVLIATEPRPRDMAGVPAHRGCVVTRPSAWHTIGRALGMVAALPARAVGLAIAHRPQLIRAIGAKS